MSYRRQDTDWVSMSLFNALKQQFPNDTVFKDFHVIRAGEDFTKAIESNLRSCDVLLVIIGAEWLTCQNGAGVSRLFDPNDYVSFEIAYAFEKGKKVIPVLIKDTPMPEVGSLPSRIKELHKLQAVRINNINFEMDVFNLANAIRDAIGERNQYADLVKDIATGKISQQELVKPETNAAYAVVCICFGLLILFLNSDSVSSVLICGAIATAGGYAYFLSQQVKSLWLNKKFEKARQNARKTKLISLITPAAGFILMLIVLLYKGFQFVDNGGLNEVNNLVSKIQSASLAQSQVKTVTGDQSSKAVQKLAETDTRNVAETRDNQAIIPEAINLTGQWFDPQQSFYFAIRQEGDQLFYDCFNTLNVLTGSGTGAINGREVTLSGTGNFWGMDYNYTGQFILTSTNNELSGSVAFSSSYSERTILTRR